MPRGGRIGPPHVTRSRNAFDALDMFKKLIAAGPNNPRIWSSGENRIWSAGEFRIHDV